LDDYCQLFIAVKVKIAELIEAGEIGLNSRSDEE